jgi:cytoskeleton protein RodZ
VTTAERTPGGFGSKLRDARERKGISLRQIANTTKISVSALEALERNDISRLPGGIFSRAFVRSYAVEVGLEPEATIQDFIAQFPHDSVTAGHPTSSQIDDNEALESDRRMAYAFLRLLAVSLPIAGVVLYFGISGWRRSAQAPEPGPPAVSAPKMELAPPIRPAVEVAQAVAPASDPAAPVDHLTVELVASGRCWVNATADGKRVMGRQMETGERQAFDVRREIMITAGDAGALNLTLNGAAAKPLGKPGEVVTTRLNLTNFREYLANR